MENWNIGDDAADIYGDKSNDADKLDYKTGSAGEGQTKKRSRQFEHEQPIKISRSG